MLESTMISNILFLDIETVPQHARFDDASKPMQQLWEKKSKYLIKDETETPDTIYRQAGIYAEFGKVICISCGYFSADRKLRIKSFAGDDERAILLEFAEMLSKFFCKNDKQLCAHNGKEFDFPFLARRMVINGVPLPAVLEISGTQGRYVTRIEKW